MKKALLVLFVLMCALTLSAKVSFVLNVKPYFTFDNAPAGIDEDEDTLVWKNSTGLVNDNWWETKQDYWLRAFEKPGFLDLGLTVDTDKVDMVFILDVRQDTLQHFKDDGKIMTNIPFVGAMIDLNFPRVGYVDYTSTDQSIYLSLGRRQIKWGPSTYDMALSDSQPFLDNFYASYNTPVSETWKFEYSFIGIAYKYFLGYGQNLTDGPQSTFAHRFSFSNSNFRIALAELNNVYGKEPSLLDFTPFGLWHDNYQDSFSNVMLNVAVEGTIGPVRIFGTFTMDDFDLPHEPGDNGWSNKPQAMGFTAGIEYHIMDGEDVKSTKFDYSDYAIVEENLKKTGFNVGYEFYYCSTFMYNRNTAAGKYTSPFQFISLTGGGYCYDQNAFYLGFKYGPDTLVHRFYVEYEASPIKAWASAELIKRGSYTIESKYGDSDDYVAMGLNTMKLTDPVTTTLKIEAGASYNVQAGLQALAEVGYTRDMTHSTQAFSATIGASVSVMEVDWNNLF